MAYMDKYYNSYVDSLLKNSNHWYKRIIDDANCKWVLVENINALWEKYCDKWYWHHFWFGDNEEYGKDMGAYAFKKIKEHEVKPDWNSLPSISASEVNAVCDKYDDLIDIYGSITSQLAGLKENLGSQSLYVDGKNFDSKIDDAIKIMVQNQEAMKKFTQAVRDRAPFLEDFQKCVQLDYIRYFGYVKQSGKYWDRVNQGWKI